MTKLGGVFVGINIGGKLRSLRQKNNLTQKELADRCELSKGFISQLESNQTSPSLSTLEDILTTLGSSFHEFFSDEQGDDPVCRKEDVFVKEDDGVTIHWLIPNAQKKDIEPILVTIQPGAETETDLPHMGEEFGYVLSGAVTLEEKPFNLRQMVDDFDTFEAPKDLKTVIITPMEHPACSTVSDDQEGGARMACEYFLNRGHKNVYFVSGKKEALSSQCRMKGWRAALEARGIEPPEPLQGDWNADSGYAAGLVLADKPDCTAVLAANDCMANGVMMALRDKGLSVPDDVSVIGFDDELYKTIPNSILTSVKFRHRELGVRALNEVVAGLEAPSSRSRTLVSGVLVERSSVKDLRA